MSSTAIARFVKAILDKRDRLMDREAQDHKPVEFTVAPAVVLFSRQKS
jgi:hypothetical protein